MGRALTTRGAVMVVLAAATVLLSGCAPAAPPAAESPPPSSQPIFASDAEALAAAEAAYAAYLAVSNSVAQAGGQGEEAFRAVAIEQGLEVALEGAQAYRDAGARAIGDARLYFIEIQQATYDTFEDTLVMAYVCVDVSAVDVLDTGGKSLVSPDRPEIQAYETSFEFGSTSKLLVSGRDSWEDISVCD